MPFISGRSQVKDALQARQPSTLPDSFCEESIGDRDHGFPFCECSSNFNLPNWAIAIPGHFMLHFMPFRHFKMHSLAPQPADGGSSRIAVVGELDLNASVLSRTGVTVISFKVLVRFNTWRRDDKRTWMNLATY